MANYLLPISCPFKAKNFCQFRTSLVFPVFGCFLFRQKSENKRTCFAWTVSSKHINFWTHILGHFTLIATSKTDHLLSEWREFAELTWLSSERPRQTEACRERLKCWRQLSQTPVHPAESSLFHHLPVRLQCGNNVGFLFVRNNLLTTANSLCPPRPVFYFYFSFIYFWFRFYHLEIEWPTSSRSQRSTWNLFPSDSKLSRFWTTSFWKRSTHEWSHVSLKAESRSFPVFLGVFFLCAPRSPTSHLPVFSWSSVPF